MTRDMVQGIVTDYKAGGYDEGQGRRILGLGMPRTPDQASMTFNLEWILEHWFMGKNITIIVNDEEGNPSIEKEDVKLVPEDELAKAYGVV